jgi:tyrosyl-tRNA synthetase
MVEQGAAKSKSEARRLVSQGGVYINDQRIDVPDRVLTLADVSSDNNIMLRVGKKNYFPVKVE